jgi:16S rRNA G966 N2-methylase RsmD
MHTRPTSDRLRETLFNVVEPHGVFNSRRNHVEKRFAQAVRGGAGMHACRSFKPPALEFSRNYAHLD